MANPQHIEWLEEGVDAWNARRRKQKFIPDFTDFNFTEFLLKGNRVIAPRGSVTSTPYHVNWINLSGALLENAVLKDLVLSQANFSRADAKKANFNNSFLWQCNFMQADIRGADFKDADIGRADINGADARTLILYDDSGITLKATDFSTAKYVKQARIQEMLGDSGTLLPARDTIRHPKHWEKLKLPENPVQPQLDPEEAELGHVDKWRTQRRIEVRSMNPR